MGKIARQTESEIRQLPFMLGKLLGGAMAAFGLPAVVFILTRKTNPSLSDIVPYLLVGIAGIVLFTAFSQALASRTIGRPGQTPEPRDKICVSIISWVLLLILAGLFLFFTFIMAK